MLRLYLMETSLIESLYPKLSNPKSMQISYEDRPLRESSFCFPTNNHYNMKIWILIWISINDRFQLVFRLIAAFILLHWQCNIVEGLESLTFWQFRSQTSCSLRVKNFVPSKIEEMHLCSQNLRIGVETDGDLFKVQNNILSGLLGELYNKFIFQKSRR